MADYKKTLNLPKTAYPMKADLVHKEPETLKFWEQNNTYEVMQNASGAKGTYVLHDGPPYANGHIHLGTALNKILKDIIIKSKIWQAIKPPMFRAGTATDCPLNAMWKRNWAKRKPKCRKRPFAAPAENMHRNSLISKEKNLNALAYSAIGITLMFPWTLPMKR